MKKKTLVRLIVTAVALFAVYPAVSRGCHTWACENLFCNVPLYAEAKDQQWDTVKRLVEQGDDINESSDAQNDRTAIFWAIWYQREDMVAFLLAHRASMQKTDSHDCTALDMAEFPVANDKGARKRIIDMIEKAGGIRSAKCK